MTSRAVTCESKVRHIYYIRSCGVASVSAHVADIVLCRVLATIKGAAATCNISRTTTFDQTL